jgi:hypothetical protein
LNRNCSVYDFALEAGLGGQPAWSIGGFAPLAATAVVIAIGNIFGRRWYTVAFAGPTAIVGALLLRETRGHDISA